MIFAPVGIPTRTVFKSIPAPHVRISKDERLRMQEGRGASATARSLKKNTQPSIKNDTPLHSNGSSIAWPHTDRRSVAALFRPNGSIDENGVSGCRVILRWTIPPSAQMSGWECKSAKYKRDSAQPSRKG